MMVKPLSEMTMPDLLAEQVLARVKSSRLSVFAEARALSATSY